MAGVVGLKGTIELVNFLDYSNLVMSIIIYLNVVILKNKPRDLPRRPKIVICESIMNSEDIHEATLFE